MITGPVLKLSFAVEISNLFKSINIGHSTAIVYFARIQARTH